MNGMYNQKGNANYWKNQLISNLWNKLLVVLEYEIIIVRVHSLLTNQCQVWIYSTLKYFMISSFYKQSLHKHVGRRVLYMFIQEWQTCNLTLNRNLWIQDYIHLIAISACKWNRTKFKTEFQLFLFGNCDEKKDIF